MHPVPKEILHAVQTDADAEFDALVSNEDCCFLVDWREEEEQIVVACEAVLQTGHLTSRWSEEDFFVIFKGKQIKVPLTFSGADRHIALRSLNEALAPTFEVRLLYASCGSDTLTFVPLARDAWAALEQAAPEVVVRRFHVLTPHPNVFTERIILPQKPRKLPWWQFWSNG